MAFMRRARRDLPEPRLPPRKPSIWARQVSLFERTVSVALAPAAVEILFDLGRVLSEGGTSGRQFAGSTMVSVDLLAARGRISDRIDAATVSQLAALCARDERIRARGRALALAEASARAGGPLERAAIDLESRCQGTELHLSLNVEAFRRSS